VQARDQSKKDVDPTLCTRNQGKTIKRVYTCHFNTIEDGDLKFSFHRCPHDSYSAIPDADMNIQGGRAYTSQPPDFELWGAKLLGESSQGLARDGLDHGTGKSLAAGAPKIDVGTKVECLFKDPEVPSDDGKWYSGTVESRNENGTWKIVFEDGDEGDFAADDPDLRLEASGPWAIWLDAYLSDLLLSAYRAYRRNPWQVDVQYFSMVQNPEKFDDSSEFQPRNFCDVARLCDVVDLCDDTASASETPAKTPGPDHKRRRDQS
jgi:hypothetical protein